MKESEITNPEWKSDLNDFTEWFSEKGSQIVPGVLTAFNITIESRYGKVDEIQEMLDFAKVTAMVGVASYIAKAFYNSKTCRCHFDFKEGIERQPDVLNIIWCCAMATIRSFEWAGDSEYHGVNCGCNDCRCYKEGNPCRHQ